MRKTLAKVLLASAVVGASLVIPQHVYAQAVGENVALNQKVTIVPNPNYSYTKDKNPQQLTDGIYASTKAEWDEKHQTSSLWIQKGAISWASRKPVIINIDLGKEQPISGLVYSTAAGKAGVVWPNHIYAAVSSDNETWHYVGDLAKLSKQQPPAEGYANQRYIVEGLKTHGRYVAIGVVQDFVVTIDEIEVLRGEESLLNQPAGREIPPMEQFVAQETITAKARIRQGADITAIRALIDKSNLSAQQKSTFTARLDQKAAENENMEALSTDFKTIIPITPIHRDILAIQGEVLAAQDVKPFTVWKKHRYAWLPIIHQPETKQAASLDFSVLRNQVRSDAILLTNASNQPMTVQFRLENVPAGVQSGWIKMDSVIWTDTYNNTPVQDALIPLESTSGLYSLDIPAGLTGKLWVTIDSSKIAAGKYKSTFILNGNGERVSVPLNIDIAQTAMPTPRMSLTTWDYTDGKGAYGITPENRDAAIRLMRSHFLDSPWARGWTLPTPKAADFDANNQLNKELNFSTFEQWLQMWPGVRNYMIFYNVRGKDSFADAKMGTPEFEARIKSWIDAVVKHAKAQGVEPSRLVFCPVDETRSDEWDLELLTWGKAIKKANPQIRLFSDPIWRNPQNAKYPEAYQFVDILSPHPNWEDDFYVKAAKKNPNQELWLYNGPGLNSTGDPQLAYRQMAWRVFEAGGNGMGFWAFGDLSGAESSWNTYTATKLIYAPVFLDKDTVHNSVHWDAVRDGVQDFEELSMLQDAIEKSSNTTLKAEAQKLLDSAVKAANTIPSEGSVDDDKGIYNWNRDLDATIVDTQLAKVRAMLIKMQG